MQPRILFILKRREDYNSILHSPKGLSTGLFNSANFMNEMLQDMGYISNIEVAIDNNCIDGLVSRYKPTHVIIEALWVVPSKFYELCRLHPNVKWIIRLHSELPFLAGEGMSFDWLADYVTYKNIYIGVNAPRMLGEVREYLKTVSWGWSNSESLRRVIYLPNYYPEFFKKKEFDRNKKYVDIACFGAVRPLKNHMVQALAALKFANEIGKKLRFHINMGRVEMKGDPVMRNLKALFSNLHKQGHQLIGYEWRPREEFLELCSEMDIGLQCNFSETFNIVSADLISQGVPIVGSSEIPWASCWFNAAAANSDDIARIILRTYKYPKLNLFLNQAYLKKYVQHSKQIWDNYFRGI